MLLGVVVAAHAPLTDDEVLIRVIDSGQEPTHGLRLHVRGWAYRLEEKTVFDDTYAPFGVPTNEIVVFRDPVSFRARLIALVVGHSSSDAAAE